MADANHIRQFELGRSSVLQQTLRGLFSEVNPLFSSRSFFRPREPTTPAGASSEPRKFFSGRAQGQEHFSSRGVNEKITPTPTGFFSDPVPQTEMAPLAVWDAVRAANPTLDRAGAYQMALRTGCLHPDGVKYLDMMASSWGSVAGVQEVLHLYWGVEFGLRPMCPEGMSLDLSDAPMVLAIVSTTTTMHLGRTGGGYDTFHGSTPGQLGWQSSTTFEDLGPEDLVILDQDTANRVEALFNHAHAKWGWATASIWTRWVLGAAHPSWPEATREDWDDCCLQCSGSREEIRRKFVEDVGRMPLWALKMSRL